MKKNYLFVGLCALLLSTACSKDPETTDPNPDPGEVENPTDKNDWNEIVQQAPVLEELPAFEASAESCEYDAEKGLAVIAYKDVSLDKAQEYGDRLAEDGFTVWRQPAAANTQAKVSLETVDRDSLVEQILESNGLLSDSSLLGGRYNAFYYRLQESEDVAADSVEIGGVSASIVHLNLQEQADSTGCNFRMRVLNTRTELAEPEVPDSVVLAQERAALVELYGLMGGDRMTYLQNWLTDAPVGEWTGIATNERGRVVKIAIAQNPDPVESFGGLLKKFSELQSLTLQQGNFGSGIFSEIGELSGLTYLNIGYMPLQCEFPEAIFQLKELDTLALNSAGLQGAFPTGWSQLPKLKSLALMDNDLTGSVPEELAALERLEYLNICRNRLSGMLPAEVTAMPAWTSNDNYSQQDGYGFDVPESLAKEAEILLEIVEKIKEKNPYVILNWDTESDIYQWNGLGFSSDHITSLGEGTSIVLDAELFEKICGLTGLTNLRVGSDDNVIPEQISRLENLETLSVWSYTEAAVQPFPEGVFSLSRLKELILSIKLESLPDGFDRLPELESLSLQCEMSGGFPESVLSLPKLCNLNLQNNNLTGEVPFAALAERSWESLNLRNNRFEGVVDVSADYYNKLITSDILMQQSGFGFRFSGTLSHEWLPKGGCMTALQAPGDSEFAYGWRQENLVDGKVGSIGWWSNSLPARVTVSFTDPVELDSIRIYHRDINSPNFFYKMGNPRKILLYGYQGEVLPQDGTLDGWELIEELNSVKPSGLEEGCTEEDIAYISKGEGFALPAGKPAYRHIKLVVTEVWEPTFECVSIMEVDVKGSTTFE